MAGGDAARVVHEGVVDKLGGDLVRCEGAEVRPPPLRRRPRRRVRTALWPRPRSRLRARRRPVRAPCAQSPALVSRNGPTAFASARGTGWKGAACACASRAHSRPLAQPRPKPPPGGYITLFAVCRPRIAPIRAPVCDIYRYRSRRTIKRGAENNQVRYQYQKYQYQQLQNMRGKCCPPWGPMGPRGPQTNFPQLFHQFRFEK